MKLSLKEHVHIICIQIIFLQVHSAYHGIVSLSFLGPKTWDLKPLDIKQYLDRQLSESLKVFKL